MLRETRGNTWTLTADELHDSFHKQLVSLGSAKTDRIMEMASGGFVGAVLVTFGAVTFLPKDLIKNLTHGEIPLIGAAIGTLFGRAVGTRGFPVPKRMRSKIGRYGIADYYEGVEGKYMQLIHSIDQQQMLHPNAAEDTSRQSAK